MEYKVKSCAECEKKCENCHFRKEFMQNQIEQPKCSIVQPHEKDYIPDGKITNFLLVVLILMMIVGGYFYYRYEIAGKYINIGNTKIRIKEDSYADNLIDCGYLSLDEVQDIVDSVIGQ